MPASMTGYGRCETREDNWAHVWEIRSVNGRFLDVKWRIPNSLRSLEAGWEKQVRKHASRGRVDIFLNMELLRADLLDVTLNKPLAEAMIDQLQGLAEKRGASFEPDLNKIFGMSSLWRDNNSEPDEGLARSLSEGLEGALRDWIGARRGEGEIMARDIKERLVFLRDVAQKIGERVPVVLEEKKAGLEQRIREMLDKVGADLNEDRMLQEVAYLTDKLDVSEELTRLAAHLDRLDEVVLSDKEVGKKLDFLIQETFREINTCGNKAQDTEVSRLVVDFKAELEKCREQVQNIE